MSFFDDLPEPPARLRSAQPALPEWAGPPSDELPGIVAVGDFVLRGPNAVVALKMVEVFSTGCLLDLVWSVRRSDESDQEWRDVMERTFQRPDRPGIMIGAALPDGRKAFSGRSAPSPFDDPDAVTGPVLVHRGGGGGSAGDEQAEGSARYWLWPLPEGGDLQLVAKWDDLGLPEGTVVIPGEPLARARSEVRGYWSE
ncbi:hypothetical protein [Paenarthrobacter nitroguajacolicus]|uniref:hypothetical protein n=1 Tax=Paenarthrobacter nitroguajacolicus TaxID=211146 RepID=UPI00248B5724|nr:hypothetical protein [Paenarthrobacter nitroguajacolicus]MDI2035867.1 hypothetical protein [Paenarthrobacter nitroguajacolicus]